MNGASKIFNPLDRLSDKEHKMVEDGIKHLAADMRLGSDLGKAFGNELQDSACG